MKKYDVDEIIARHRQDIDDGQWVPAEVAQQLYDALEDLMNFGYFVPGALRLGCGARQSPRSPRRRRWRQP